MGKEKQWWLVTPGGHAFLSLEINHLNPILFRQAHNSEAWRKRLNVSDRVILLGTSEAIKNRPLLQRTVFHTHIIERRKNIAPNHRSRFILCDKFVNIPNERSSLTKNSMNRTTERSRPYTAHRRKNRTPTGGLSPLSTTPFSEIQRRRFSKRVRTWSKWTRKLLRSGLTSAAADEEIAP